MAEEKQPNLILRYDPRSLRTLFTPKTVAVIGASEKPDSLGRAVLENLLNPDYPGKVFPVNLNHAEVLGRPAYASVLEIPDRVSLAVIVVPAAAVPQVVEECVAKEIRSAIIISSGFREIGEAGKELEQAVLERARAGRMRLIGPNSLGVITPGVGFNASAARQMARPGRVAFLSQSAALTVSILDWSLRENVGFSALVSLGGMIDVDWADLIYYLGDDSRTESIVIYLETIDDARSFLSAVREVALTKPIIILKSGRSAAAAAAAATHTGALAGQDDVFEAALRRAGALRVHQLSDLFYTAETLGKQTRPRGPRLAIITNTGAQGIIAADALSNRRGTLAAVSPASEKQLRAILPPHWQPGSPIDIMGDASPERFARVVEIVAADDEVDGLLVILAPHRATQPTETAERLVALAKEIHKPILANWNGASLVAEGEAVLTRSGIPTFGYPETAVRVFENMWRYSRNLEALYETPQLPDLVAGHQAATGLVDTARREGRTLLTIEETRALLAAYQIPLVDTRLVKTAADAVAAAGELGYPVAIKLHSSTILHKSDVGGVILNVTRPEDVTAAVERLQARFDPFEGALVQPMLDTGQGYELVIGSAVDEQFGPVLLFGSGGLLVEFYQDRALGLPPLNRTLARRLMERTRIYGALKGIRGRPPVDQEALEELLVRFSQLVAEQAWIQEIDINPLLVSAVGIVALDAQILLHPAGTLPADLPRLAIRPYPRQYVRPFTAKNGETLLIRPIRGEDEPLVRVFHRHLSDQSVFLRYFQNLTLEQRVTHDRLVRMCFIDYDREIALVVEREAGAGGQPEIVGVGRLSKVRNSDEAEFAMIMRDDMQGLGLGTELLRRLIEIGRREDIGQIVAYTLPENGGMRHIFKRLGFNLTWEDGLTKATLVLLGLEVGAGG